MFIEDALSLNCEAATSLLIMREGLCRIQIYSIILHVIYQCFSAIWTLKQKRSGQWNVKRVFMGGNDICHGNLVGESRANFITSFGEDENGKYKDK